MNEKPCSNQEIHLPFENGSELENTSNEPCIICMTLYTEHITDQTGHFADVLVRENVVYGYDIVTGWVVTWFLIGYTVRMFEYTVRTF